MTYQFHFCSGEGLLSRRILFKVIQLEIELPYERVDPLFIPATLPGHKHKKRRSKRSTFKEKGMRDVKKEN